MASGSRQIHTKSRNGCSQCKRRRVRCNLEPPICSNCRRRKETCDYSLGYPTLSVSSTRQVASTSISTLNPTPTSLRLLTQRGNGTTLSSPIPYRYLETLQRHSESILSSQRAFSDVMQSFFEKAYAQTEMPNTEFMLWTQEFNYHIKQFSYLEPTFRSIKSLFHWLNGGQMLSQSYASAICHNIEASNRFRLSSLRVTETNWLAMMLFGIGIMIFHFCIALSSSDSDFDFLDVFHVLRKSGIIGRQIEPYFRRSQFQASLKRPYTHDERIYAEILTATRQLDAVLYPEGTSEEMKLAYHQTVELLGSWIVSVEGCPQVWREFVTFPEEVPEAYLQLLQGKNPLALVIFVYWCVVMHQAPYRWFMDGWACRAAESAMSYLGPEWAGLLEWPRVMLDSPPTYISSPRSTIKDHYSKLVLSVPYSWLSEGSKIIDPTVLQFKQHRPDGLDTRREKC